MSTATIELIDASTGLPRLAKTTDFGAAPKGSPADRSGTITEGGTAQQLMAANTARIGFSIQNLSTGDLWINGFGTAAARRRSQPTHKQAATAARSRAAVAVARR